MVRGAKTRYPWAAEAGGNPAAIYTFHIMRATSKEQNVSALHKTLKKTDPHSLGGPHRNLIILGMLLISDLAGSRQAGVYLIGFMKRYESSLYSNSLGSASVQPQVGLPLADDKYLVKPFPSLEAEVPE